MIRAVFLDRDGVINPPALNPSNNLYEAPHSPETFELFPHTIESLQKLLASGYELFLISNQPDYAKGKTTLENLNAVHEKMKALFEENNIFFKAFYYCYHHEESIVPEYKVKCHCRKPGTKFIETALTKFYIDIDNSWIVGDRDTDIYCGKKMNLKTIQVAQIHPDGKAGDASPDFNVNNLQEATDIIINK